MDVTTALAIVVPNEHWERINKIRSVYDRAHPRWMPHINFIFPFISRQDFPLVKARLERRLNGFGNFSVNLESVDYFPQKSGATFHLRPRGVRKFKELSSEISIALPGLVSDKPFKPHMTLGQAKSSREMDDLSTIISKWLGENPISFEVTEVCILGRSRDDNEVPFTIVHRIPLE